MTNYASNLFDFHKFDPFAVGYEKMFDDLQEMAKSMTKLPTYPPYNIRQIKDNKWVIEVAVAGFSKSDIEVTLEGNKLVIKGASQYNAPEEGTFLHKGIATRNFTHEFKIADKIEIENAELANGMLKIWLENLIKTQDMVKKISVKSKE
jgi:molecular chaperone IbpA